jgi:hypothetical protein
MVMFLLWLLTVVVATAVVFIILCVCNRPRPCPTCRAKALTWIGYATPRTARTCVPQPEDRHYRCAACHAEFCRRDRGGLVGKAAWDAGARDAIPIARVV